MPPLNTYIFYHLYHRQSEIVIKAYSRPEARRKFEEIVKNPEDFKLKLNNN